MTLPITPEPIRSEVNFSQQIDDKQDNVLNVLERLSPCPDKLASDNTVNQAEDLLLLLNKQVIKLEQDVCDPKSRIILQTTVTVGKREVGKEVDLISEELNKLIQFRTLKNAGLTIEITPLFVTPKQMEEKKIKKLLELFIYGYPDFDGNFSNKPCICVWNDQNKQINFYYLGSADDLITSYVNSLEELQQRCQGKQIVCMTRDAVVRLSQDSNYKLRDLEDDAPDVYLLDIERLCLPKTLKNVISAQLNEVVRSCADTVDQVKREIKTAEVMRPTPSARQIEIDRQKQQKSLVEMPSLLDQQIRQCGEILIRILHKTALRIEHIVTNKTNGSIIRVPITVGKPKVGESLDLITDECNKILQLRNLTAKDGHPFLATPLFAVRPSFIENDFIKAILEAYESYNPCMLLWNDKEKGIYIYYCEDKDLKSSHIKTLEELQQKNNGRQIIGMNYNCVLNLYNHSDYQITFEKKPGSSVSDLYIFHMKELGSTNTKVVEPIHPTQIKTIDNRLPPKHPKKTNKSQT